MKRVIEWGHLKELEIFVQLRVVELEKLRLQAEQNQCIKVRDVP